MVISFEEKDRAAIEAKGVTIIKFKSVLYRNEKIVTRRWDSPRECVEYVLKAWDIFKKWFEELVDELRLLLEEIKNYSHYPTIIRYKVVKYLNKCTGIDIYKLWKMTRHTWLARSCC